jgi:hypothetical protein
MRKLLIVNMAVATLAAGTLTSDRAQATTFAGSAGARTAIEGASPLEEIARRYPPRPRHYGYPPQGYRSGYKPYSPPSRINRPGGFHFR